jgi:hypothetical protein
MVRADGDWVSVAQAIFGQREWIWRPGGFIVGLLLYAAGLRVTAIATRSLVGGDQRGATARVRSLLRTTWIAASASMVLASAAYAPDRVGAMRQASLEIGAASIALLFIARRLVARTTSPREPLHQSVGWIVLSALVYAAFVATLGRGLY